MTVDAHPRTSPAGGRGRPLSRWTVRAAAPRDALAVVALLAVAIVLSAPALAPSSLWLDDAWLALVHRLPELSDVLAAGLTSPGFAVLLKGVFAMVGFSELAAQAVPFAAGVATPAVAYLVGRRIGLRTLGAALAAVVLLLSPVRIEYAGRVKPFAVDALTTTVLLWLAWRTAERPEARGRWIVLTLVALVATFVSTSAAVVAGPVMAGATLAAWGTPARGRALGWTAGYAVVAGAWVLGVVSPRLGPALHDYWAGRYLEGPGDVWRVVRAFASDLAAFEHAAAVAGLTAALVVAFALAARRRLWQAVLLAGPMVVAAALATAGRAPLGTGRTDLYLYPLVALGAAWALHHLPWPRSNAWPRRGAMLLAFAALAAAAVPPPQAGYPVEEFRPLTAVLERHVGADDLVLLTSSTIYGVALYGPWTAGIRPAPTTTSFEPVFSDDRFQRAPGGAQLDQLAPMLRDVPDGGRVWVFSSLTSSERGDEIADAVADAGWRLERRSAADGATLERWRRQGG